MLRITTLNLNGIRSACKKGFLDWVNQCQPDIVCLQEIKAQLCDLDVLIQAPKDYRGYFHCAHKKGYSGVGIYSRKSPDRVVEGMGIKDIDVEGRYLRVDYGGLSVISLYVPSGTTSEERQKIKFDFMKRFMPHLKEIKESGREFILCGDWNIAHKEIDLKNWRSNQKNSGFLPEERVWLTEVFENAGFVDVFRRLNQQPDQYTWWSNRGQAWAKNVGWRIDYHIATPRIAALARSTSIYKDQRFSDHAPLTIDYDYQL